MKRFLLFLFPLSALAQDGRQLVALTIRYAPDRIEGNQYYLITEKPASVKVMPRQTFLLQSAWHKEGDSIVTIGAGTVRSFSDTSAELVCILYPGKQVQEGDMALFLVPLPVPATDTLFFKLARVGIVFTTVNDSLFYERNAMLRAAETFPTHTLLQAMAADIRYTGAQMKLIRDAQDRDITIGNYKGKKLFDMMQQVSADEVADFIQYVYARPDKYKAHTWKISETFATWAINGAPRVKK